MRQQPLNPKVGLLRSISLNLHSNILERVSVFLRELATPFLLVRHRSSSLGVGKSSSLGVWGRVGFLWSSNASCPAGLLCWNPRSLPEAYWQLAEAL